MSTYIGYPITNLDELPPGGQPGDVLVIGPGGQPDWVQVPGTAPGTEQRTCDTVAELKAIDVSGVVTGQQVSVAGYYAATDGGGGIFCFDSASAAADNGGTVIAPTAGSGRWLRVYDGALNLKWFGLKAGDAAANETNKTVWRSFFNVFAAGRAQTEIHIPDGDYYINFNFAGGATNIPSNTTIRMGKRTKLIVKIPTPLPAPDETSHKWMVFRIISGASDILIEGGEIVGDKVTDLVWLTGYGDGIDVGAGCSRITVRDMVIRDCWTDNFSITGGSDIRFENVESYGGQRHCASITGGKKIAIVGCRFSDPDWYMGFDMEIESAEDCEDVTFDRCVFSGSYYTGLAIVSGNSGKKAIRTKVLNCEFFDHAPRSGVPDIPAGPGPYPVPAGSGTSLNLQDARDFTVENCVFHDNDPQADTLSAGSCNRGLITGCNINGGRKGIFFPNSQSISILNNIVRNTTDDAIATGASLPAFPVINNRVGHNTIMDIGTPNVVSPPANAYGKGIDIRGCASQVFGNRIERIQTVGIIVNFAQNILVTGNKVSECGLSTAPVSDGIFIIGTGHLVFGNDVKKCAVSQSATAQAGGASTITLSANASISNGDYVGYKVTILAGTGSGQTGTITGYVGTTKVATISAPWATPPNNTSVYEIIPAGNCQRYGIFHSSEKSTIYGNDTNLGGMTAGFLEGGIGTMGITLGPQASLAITGTTAATYGGLGSITTAGGIYAALNAIITGEAHLRNKVYVADDIGVISPGQPDLGKAGAGLRFRGGFFSSTVDCLNLKTNFGVLWNLGGDTVGTPGAVTKLVKADIGGTIMYLHAQTAL